ncbi:MAG: carboxymuconolactone decarboxylase family protein [Methanomicrobiales archaeon]|nr:carboxymuconolactone decarboxylase family protein [Methanomicrobiales archaeon]MDD1655086.1 carboxymuconolactone decarboxylase family protein [Methanomicrobiales archaeon]
MTFEETLDTIVRKGSRRTAQDWMKQIQQEYGQVPFIFQRMAEQPEVLISHLLYKGAVTEKSTLDPKTVELISMAVGAALQCSHCVDYHMQAATAKGATREEILEVILIAGLLANSVVLAEAYRVMEHRLPQCGGSCDTNGVAVPEGKNRK